MKKIDLMSIPLSVGPYRSFSETIICKAKAREKDYVCVANVHMLVEAHKNKNFSDVVRNAAIITPDGQPLTWALKWLHGIKQDRVAGMDLLPDLFAAASQENLSVFFYGGTEEVLQSTKEYVALYYPGMVMAGTLSPPFRNLSVEDENIAVQQINQSGAHLVFVVLGCPKQEKWMSAVHDRINAVLVGVGGALSVIIGIQKRAPIWMQSFGLEWLYRLAQEPKRLFRRYAFTNTLFLYLLAKNYISTKVVKKKFHRLNYHNE